MRPLDRPSTSSCRCRQGRATSPCCGPRANSLPPSFRTISTRRPCIRIVSPAFGSAGSTVNRAQIGCARIIAVRILVKSLIVWCLLLAVPFQGFASATMLFCAPIPSRDVVAPAATATSQHHDHAAMMAAKHAEHDHQKSDDHAATPHGADQTSSANHHDGSKCNTCAACCFGASMPPSASVRIAVDAQHFTAVPVDSGSVPAVELALPERPPQASLA